MIKKEKAKMTGIVKMQLTDKNGKRKPLFQANKLWEVFKRLFEVDIKLPFITGMWTLNMVTYNAIKNAGVSESAKLLGGVAADAISHMAIGIGTGGTTTLNSEITTAGGERNAVTPTSETTTTAGDTVKSDSMFSFTGTFAVTEEGVLNAGAAGDLIAYQTFSAVNVVSGDSLQVVHSIVFSAA